MSITQWAEKSKLYWRIILIILLAFLFFSLWELNKENASKTPLKIINTIVNGQSAVLDQPQTVIASKNGTKYYFPWCGALNRVKPENRISFASPELARNAGYSPATNCKGVR